jgi:hypothetical protein
VILSFPKNAREQTDPEYTGDGRDQIENPRWLSFRECNRIYSTYNPRQFSSGAMRLQSWCPYFIASGLSAIFPNRSAARVRPWPKYITGTVGYNLVLLDLDQKPQGSGDAGDVASSVITSHVTGQT